MMSFSFRVFFLPASCEANAPRREIHCVLCDNAESFFEKKKIKRKRVTHRSRAKEEEEDGATWRKQQENKGTKWNISWRISFMLKRMNIMCMYKLCGVEWPATDLAREILLDSEKKTFCVTSLTLNFHMALSSIVHQSTACAQACVLFSIAHWALESFGWWLATIYCLVLQNEAG